MPTTEKWMHYASKITATIQEMFDEESEYHIDLEDFQDDDNATQFFHALANVAPAYIFNKLTGDTKNFLEFNHVANRLVFQYSDKED